jgi:hypothetical protein
LKGIVKIDDRLTVHVIPRAEVRYVEIVALGNTGDWELQYQLASGHVRSVEWKGEGRPESLKTKIEVDEYNKMAAEFLLTVLTRGHRDVHLERRSDNVFLVRSGLVEDDARVVLCRQFIAEMATTAKQPMIAGFVMNPLEDARLHMLDEIYAAARDLILPDWYPLKEEPS